MLGSKTTVPHGGFPLEMMKKSIPAGIDRDWSNARLINRPFYGSEALESVCCREFFYCPADVYLAYP